MKPEAATKQWISLLSCVSFALSVAEGVGGDAKAQEVSDIGRDLVPLEAHAQRLARSSVTPLGARGARFVEERLAEGELNYRLRDYDRASVLLYDVVEHYPTHPAHPDALILLGDTLYAWGDLSGARIRYQEVLDRAHEPRYRGYAHRAMVGLLDIVTKTREFQNVDKYVSKLDRFAAIPEFAGAVSYFRGKLLYLKAVPVPPGDAFESSEATPIGDVVREPQLLELSKRSFELVPQASPLFSSATYFLGTIAILRQQFPLAATYFVRAANAKATTQDQQVIQELAHIATGRCYYELDEPFRAIPYYDKIAPTSPRFDVAQYELAWAYLRVGDADRAQRALEALSVTNPNSRFIAEAGVLRGNLLIREGKHAQAYKVFASVKQRFGPVVQELDGVLERKDSTVAFFQQLARDQKEPGALEAVLPARVRPWVKPDGKYEPALKASTEVVNAQRRVEATQSLARRLEAGLGASNPVAIFADSRDHRQQTIAIRNRFTDVRRAVIRSEAKAARGMKSIANVGAAQELDAARKERVALESALDKLPTNPADFLKEDATVERQRAAYNGELSRLTTELSGLEARVVALQTYLSDPTRRTPLAEDEKKKILDEVEAQQKLTSEFRETLAQLKDDVEVTTLGGGLGASRVREDEQLRIAYRDAVAREHQILASLGTPSSATYGAYLQRVENGERLLDQADAQTDEALTARVANMRATIEHEKQSLAKQAADSQDVRADGAELVGSLMYEGLKRARDRFHDVTLKADVGVIDIAWADREEHRMRVDTLSRERARELQALEDEFRDILEQEPQEPETGAKAAQSGGPAGGAPEGSSQGSEGSEP